MRLNNREEPLTPICATENIPLFVMYLKNELSTQHKAKLDKHLRDCDDCKVNFLYVEEILKDRHPISMDEKTLLLKYLTDPLFYYFANNVRKKVLEDVKELLQEAKIEVKKMASSGIDTTTSKPTKALTKLHQVPYPYFVLTVSIILFFSLGISVVLALSSKYPQLQSYLPFSNSASPVVAETLPSNLDFTLPTMSLPNRAANNRYQQLDAAIDEFLATQDRQHLTKAEFIAKDIQLLYDDNYGVDLVGYYQNIPDSLVKNLVDSRNQLKELSKQLNGDNYEKLLATAQQIEKDFSSLGNLLEAYKAKVLVAKYNIKFLNYNEAKVIINNGLSFADKNQYLFLKAYFLLWQAKRLSHIGEFREIESSFREVIELGEKLQIKELIVSPSMSLSATYYNNDYNQEALALAQKTLSLTKTENAEYTISLLQIAGIAAFNLHYYQLSNSYLNESVQISNKINNPYFMAISYSFLGLTSSEQQDFSQSNKFYSQAQLAVKQINEDTTRLNTLSMVLGYYAKAKLSEGDFEQAIAYYQQSLSIIADLKIEPKSTIYQLNQGLAIALEKTGNTTKASQHYTIAKTYEKKAKADKETTNCLLSFMPSNCKAQY